MDPLVVGKQSTRWRFPASVKYLTRGLLALARRASCFFMHMLKKHVDNVDA